MLFITFFRKMEGKYEKIKNGLKMAKSRDFVDLGGSR